MGVLLELHVAQDFARSYQATRTPGAGSSAPTAECPVADPDPCVEER
jgi:hypothetical protein